MARVAARVAQIQQDHLLDVQNLVARGGIRVMELKWIDGYDLGRLLTPGMLRLARKRAGDERWAYLDDVIVTARALQPQLQPGIAVLRSGLSALSARHHEGIVLGDVKPSNLMLERSGNARLIDIGAACARGRPLARRPTPRPRSWRGRWARNDRADAGKASFDRNPWGTRPRTSTHRGGS